MCLFMYVIHIYILYIVLKELPTLQVARQLFGRVARGCAEFASGWVARSLARGLARTSFF